MSILNKDIKFKNLKISFKDSRDTLSKIRGLSLPRAITNLKTQIIFKNNPLANYSRCSQIIHQRLYTLFKKILVDHTNLKPENLFFEKLYITKGPLLHVSSFKRARGASSPKFKKSCNLCVKILKLNE